MCRKLLTPQSWLHPVKTCLQGCLGLQGWPLAGIQEPGFQDGYWHLGFLHLHYLCK